MFTKNLCRNVLADDTNWTLQLVTELIQITGDAGHSGYDIPPAGEELILRKIYNRKEIWALSGQPVYTHIVLAIYILRSKTATSNGDTARGDWQVKYGTDPGVLFKSRKLEVGRIMGDVVSAYSLLSTGIRFRFSSFLFFLSHFLSFAESHREAWFRFHVGTPDKFHACNTGTWWSSGPPFVGAPLYNAQHHFFSRYIYLRIYLA